MTEAPSKPQKKASQSIGRPRQLILELSPLWGLWGLAVVQPVLQLLAQNIPFLVYQQADRRDLVLLVAIGAFGGPILLSGLHALSALLGKPVCRLVDALAAGLLAAILFLGVANRSLDLVATTLFAMALGLAAAVLLVYHRSKVARSYCRLLALGLPVIVVVFFANDNVTEFLRKEEQSIEAPRVESTTPVVLLVFDEFPLVSLLDENFELDAQTFPHFAELSSFSTWYRNGTTVWETTEESFSSILSGRVAGLKVPPTLAEYPENLFTLLQNSHELRVIEALTRLAPADQEYQPGRPPRHARITQLAVDLSVFFLHTITPEELRRRLPPIESTWGHFWQPNLPWTRQASLLGQSRQNDVRELPSDEHHRSERFEQFLQAIEPTPKPGLFFFHSLLPHTPYYYLPSGKVYKGEPFLTGDPREAWRHYPWFGLLTYQRHLLQVGYVDRLVGRVLDRLRQTGLLDRSLVIIAGDHGSSHWPQGSRRLPNKMPHPEDILRVPLFVKYPFQSEPVVDDSNAQTVDILPTIMKALGIEVSWPLDGRPLSTADRPHNKILHDRFGGTLRFKGDFEPDRASVVRKRLVFDWSRGPEALYALGPYGSLLGAVPGTDFDVTQLPFEVSIDQAGFLSRYDPAWSYCPAELTGKIFFPVQKIEELYLAAVVNGRIAGFGHSRLTKGRGLYSILVSDETLHKGENDVEILVVGGSPDSPQVFTSRGAGL